MAGTSLAAVAWIPLKAVSSLSASTAYLMCRALEAGLAVDLTARRGPGERPLYVQDVVVRLQSPQGRCPKASAGPILNLEAQKTGLC